MEGCIWKYTLAITNLQEVEMPLGAQILSVGDQGGQLCLWALVVPQRGSSKRVIEIIGTGNPMEMYLTYPRRFIGTVLMPPFVWHVFER
jgi:hypothetical protein